jgi:putative spermidine/putrescine transport system permease protein
MSTRVKGLAKYWTILPFAALIIAIELTPLGNIIVQSFHSPEDGSVGFQNYITIFTKAIYLKTIWNSVRLTLDAALVGLLLSFLGGLAISTASPKAQNTFMSILNMTSNFCGIPLAFAFMIILGKAGVLTQFGSIIHWKWLADFNVYTISGIMMVYVYFSVPLGTLMIIPAFNGIKKEWKEAATLMDASSFQFWTRIGVPTLLPSIVGTFSMIFANALAAYATIYALVQNNFPVLPTKIAECFTGDVDTKVELGSTLTVVMLVLMCVVLVIGNVIKKRCVKGVS